MSMLSRNNRSQPAATPSPAATAGPRAPAVQARLVDARGSLSVLEGELSELALAAAEGMSGASDKLAAHRETVEASRRHVQELQTALALAERLDREAVVMAAATLRAGQLDGFKDRMVERDKAMATVLNTVGALQKAYTSYCEATVAAELALPAGTALPIMLSGPNGILGHVFGQQEQLITGELWRIAPRGDNGDPRFALPFARCPVPAGMNPAHLPAALDAFREANEAVVAKVDEQVRTINESAMAAVTGLKEAA